MTTLTYEDISLEKYPSVCVLLVNKELTKQFIFSLSGNVDSIFIKSVNNPNTLGIIYPFGKVDMRAKVYVHVSTIKHLLNHKTGGPDDRVVA